MNDNDIYTISYDWHTPSGKWTEHSPMAFKQAASYASTMIRNSDNAQFPKLWHEMTVWGGSLEVVSVRDGKILIDTDLEPAEGSYIAAAIRNALAERSQRFTNEGGVL